MVNLQNTQHGLPIIRFIMTDAENKITTDANHISPERVKELKDELIKIMALMGGGGQGNISSYKRKVFDVNGARDKLAFMARFCGENAGFSAQYARTIFQNMENSKLPECCIGIGKPSYIDLAEKRIIFDLEKLDKLSKDDFQKAKDYIVLNRENIFGYTGRTYIEKKYLDTRSIM